MPLFGQEHVDRYLATGGEEGHDWQGTQTLILTTTGRRSGRQRLHPLIYGRHGDDYLVVASRAGRRRILRGTSTSMRTPRSRFK